MLILIAILEPECVHVGDFSIYIKSKMIVFGEALSCFVVYHDKISNCSRTLFLLLVGSPR